MARPLRWIPPSAHRAPDCFSAQRRQVAAGIGELAVEHAGQLPLDSSATAGLRACGSWVLLSECRGRWVDEPHGCLSFTGAGPGNGGRFWTLVSNEHHFFDRDYQPVFARHAKEAAAVPRWFPDNPRSGRRAGGRSTPKLAAGTGRQGRLAISAGVLGTGGDHRRFVDSAGGAGSGFPGVDPSHRGDELVQAVRPARAAPAARAVSARRCTILQAASPAGWSDPRIRARTTDRNRVSPQPLSGTPAHAPDLGAVEASGVSRCVST